MQTLCKLENEVIMTRDHDIIIELFPVPYSNDVLRLS